MAPLPAQAPKTADITPALDAIIATMRQQAASLTERLDTATGDMSDGSPRAALGALACAEIVIRDLDALLTGAMALGRIAR